jgi:hypothetical protein
MVVTATVAAGANVSVATRVIANADSNIHACYSNGDGALT